MSFEQTVEQHHKETFRGNVQMVAQQIQNPLRNAVTILPASGQAMRAADLLGKKKARRGAPDRERRNPDIPTGRSARWLIRPEATDIGEYIDKVDEFDLAMDPTSHLFRNNMVAMEQAVADIILGVEEDDAGGFSVAGSGILGLATEGNKTKTTKALPAANYVAHNNTGLTLDKLRAMKKALKKKNFGLEDDDPLFGLIAPDQEDDLLGIAEQTKTALNLFSLEQLREGKASRLMGITWLMTNRLPYDANGNRMCPFWSKKNILVGMWQDVAGKIWNDTGAKNLPYMYFDVYADAVRVEDDGVRVIECKEA